MDVLITILIKTPIYMGSLIIIDKGEKRLLELFIFSLSFPLPFFILYNNMKFFRRDSVFSLQENSMCFISAFYYI